MEKKPARRNNSKRWKGGNKCAGPRWLPAPVALIVRSGEAQLRRTRNLCLSSFIEAVCDQTRVVDLKQVNRVLIQPHWRKDCDNPL
jgi:hypothetical protein